MYKQSNTLNKTQLEIRDIIHNVEEKSTDGDYIYRGEPEHYQGAPYYGKISSNLYRQYARIDADEFNIEVVQEEILAEAEAYNHETDDPIEILTQLQHYGGKTNLIDFTTDYLIALFFVCDNSDSLTKDGRLILWQKTDEWEDMILPPRNPRHRVIAQKSVFVRHPRGFLSPDDVDIITISASLKQPLLVYLQKYHGITTVTIYNDLHGFITNQNFHEEAYAEFHRGLTSHLVGEASEILKDKHDAYEKAILHYTKALKLKPDIPEGYNNRGNAYRDNGESDKAIKDYNIAIEYKPNDAVPYNNRGGVYFDDGDFNRAIKDWNKAIEINPDFAKAYYNRGNAYFVKRQFDDAVEDYSMAIKCNPEEADAYNKRGEIWLHLHEWEKAKVDLATAIRMQIDITAVFHNTYNSVEDFEQTNEVTLPEDIASMLTSAS